MSVVSSLQQYISFQLQKEKGVFLLATLQNCTIPAALYMAGLQKQSVSIFKKGPCSKRAILRLQIPIHTYHSLKRYNQRKKSGVILISGCHRHLKKTRYRTETPKIVSSIDHGRSLSRRSKKSEAVTRRRFFGACHPLKNKQITGLR
eukprot:gene4117-2963_t